MYRECYSLIEKLGPSALDVLEISGGGRFANHFSFRSYAVTQFPDFDICSQSLAQSFDLVIADQVFEHLMWPYRAVKNVYAMVRPGGHFLVTTPFLIRVHNVPIDCSRWTELGLKCLLEEGGFPSAAIETGSWGNRACLKSNLNAWTKTGWFGSLKNEPDFPVQVWAMARK
jgi:SAM-dependent methyltransferase